MVFNVPVPDGDIDSVLMLYSDQIMIMEPADVAYVNGESISRQDFVSRMEDAAGYHILDEMINELLIRQAAEQAGITVTPDEVEIEMQNLRISYGSDYESVLWEYNMTEDELWTNIELDLLTIKYSTKDLVVNEADLRDYFRLYKADFAYPEMVRASHILVGAPRPRPGVSWSSSRPGSPLLSSPRSGLSTGRRRLSAATWTGSSAA